MIVNVYRNLTKARRDPRRFVWSVAAPVLKANGTPGRSKGKVIGHAEVIRIANPVAVCSPGTLRTIASKGERSVAAWIQGERVDGDLPHVGTRRPITMNPLPESRGGRRSMGFTFCEFIDGALVIGSPVNFGAVAAIEFTPVGAFAVMR